MPSLRHVRVSTPDGLQLAVDEAGPAHAPAVLFLHGIAQDRGVFRPLLEGALAKKLRLVAVDLRGHGDSSKPEGAEPYTDGRRFAGDVTAVLEALGLQRPVLAPWSYGGAVAGDFLRHGSTPIAGVFAIAASVRIGRSSGEFFGPAMMDHVRGLISADPAVYQATAEAFAVGCAPALSAAFAAERVAGMLRVPAHVRRALLTRDENYVPELATGSFPLAAWHGEEDRVVWPALSEHVRAEAPRTVVTLVPGAAHVAFLEAQPAFEAALEAFVQSAR